MTLCRLNVLFFLGKKKRYTLQFTAGGNGVTPAQQRTREERPWPPCPLCCKERSSLLLPRQPLL